MAVSMDIPICREETDSAIIQRWTRNAGKRIGKDATYLAHPVLAGDLIEKYRENLDPLSKKALRRLAGTDVKRLTAIYSALTLAVVYEENDVDLLNKVLGQIGGLSKVEAFRVFSLLPYALAPKKFWPSCSEETEEFKKINDFYCGVGLWLIDEHKGGHQSKLLKSLLGLESEWKRSLVCRKRYEICNYLKFKAHNDFIKEIPVPLMWLFVEISACRYDIQASYKNGDSKKKRYKRMSKFWQKVSYLDDEEEAPSVEPAKTGMQLLERFRAFFVHEARELAKTDKDFNKSFWKPYIDLEKSWGRAALIEKSRIAYL